MKTLNAISLPKYSAHCTWYEGRQYYSVQGQIYTGITTILAATRSEEEVQRFKDWEKEVGFAEAQRVRRKSTQRGKLLHKQIEGYLNGASQEPIEQDTEQHNYWQSIQPVLEKIKEAHLVEGAVWHPSGFAGVVDALVNYDGQLWVCDWKTSKKLKRWNWIQDYCLQVAAYTAAINRVYQGHGVRVAQAMIAIALPDTEAQVFQIEQEDLMEYWEIFKQRLAQFEAMH
jgi:ATP-dependent exoDNAse (exonuclease V) beta subunit